MRLAAAILLVLIIHQYPFVQAWLTIKVLLLPLYIALGIFALRRGRTRWSRAGFLAAALAVYGFILSVAVMHNPRGLFGKWGNDKFAARTPVRTTINWVHQN